MPCLSSHSQHAGFAHLAQPCLLIGLLLCALAANAQLNDSGVTVTDDTASAGQDPQYGRDAAAAAGVLIKVGSGAKGFDFTKICNSGEAAGEGSCPTNPTLGTDANDWACTRDNVTSLTWEVKTDDDGLRDKDWSYTWYDSNPATNGGNAGTADTGASVGSDNCFDNTRCDTKKYTDDVNTAGLCNFSDWRMPTIQELVSLVDYGIASPGPTIDTGFFPNSLGTEFWSGSGHAWDPAYAWILNFEDSDDSAGYKYDTLLYEYDAFLVRLVRGG